MAEPQLWTKELVVFSFQFDVPLVHPPKEPIVEPNKFRLLFSSSNECTVQGRWGCLEEAMNRFQQLVQSQGAQ